MKYYAVLDTNVIVSAMLKGSSVPGQVAAEALKGDIIPVLNDEIIAEYEDVLKRPKFRFDIKAVKVFSEELKRRAVYTGYGMIEDEIPEKKKRSCSRNAS
ncbi:MAG: PIN domain-containing protein [Lachnospiraceae bacterium]|nr:PIN domain-containing protein [uncultured Acetatifactor sp.]MCI9232147.1 PIN domain-containing protein [Lachnospiraceae bacterium]